MNEISKIYTDGACIGNGMAENIGGHGFVVVLNGEKTFEEVFVQKNTTNNRQEIKAVYNALSYCLSNKLTHFLINSDSQYVVNGFNEWMHNWAKKGFSKGSPQKEIPNADLWREMFSIKKKFDIKVVLCWVRGHSGNKWNEYIDRAIQKKITLQNKTFA